MYFLFNESRRLLVLPALACTVSLTRSLNHCLAMESAETKLHCLSSIFIDPLIDRGVGGGGGEGGTDIHKYSVRAVFFFSLSFFPFWVF